MIKETEGLLLSQNNTISGGNIVRLFSHKYGVIAGYRKGDRLFIGNIYYIKYQSINEDKMGFISLEVVQDIANMILLDKSALIYISSAITLMQKLLQDWDSADSLYIATRHLFMHITDDSVLRYYIDFEIAFLKHLGVYRSGYNTIEDLSKIWKYLFKELRVKTMPVDRVNLIKFLKI